ncbi:MAG: DUF4968 domain-containing protein, partial [Chryseobacterium sp.]
MNSTHIATFLLSLTFVLWTSSKSAWAIQNPETTNHQNQKIISAKKVGTTVIEISLSNNQQLIFDFYSDQIFRLFQDNTGGKLRDPEAKPTAKILVENPRKPVTKLELTDAANLVTIKTTYVVVEIDKNTALFKIINGTTNEVTLEESAPVSFQKNAVILSLKENSSEYFYGGGVQNGRFSHKGKSISIENQNSWTDGGVASPTPFYWSTKGYGVLWHTFKKGKYDFGANEKGLVTLMHETNYLDVFYMLGNDAAALLNNFYQLTGNPILLPKCGLYQGHLNAYNRDFWTEDEQGILFEDGKRYKESQTEKSGMKES